MRNIVRKQWYLFIRSNVNQKTMKEMIILHEKKKRLNIPHEKMKSFYYIWDVPTLTGDCIRRMKQGKRKNSRGRDRKSIDRHYWERVGTFVHIGLAFRGLKLLLGSSHPVGMPRVILWQCRTVDKLMLK